VNTINTITPSPDALPTRRNRFPSDAALRGFVFVVIWIASLMLGLYAYALTGSRWVLWVVIAAAACWCVLFVAL